MPLHYQNRFQSIPTGDHCTPNVSWPHKMQHKKDNCEELRARVTYGEIYFQKNYAKPAREATFLQTMVSVVRAMQAP